MTNKLRVGSLLFALSVLTSCGDKQHLEWVCNCQERGKVADFVTANTKAANNMSDEEMEDVISELTISGIKTHCHQKILWESNERIVNWDKSHLDTGETLHRIYY